jgi:hypothetical protein
MIAMETLTLEARQAVMVVETEAASSVTAETVEAVVVGAEAEKNMLLTRLIFECDSKSIIRRRMESFL